MSDIVVLLGRKDLQKLEKENPNPLAETFRIQ